MIDIDFLINDKNTLQRLDSNIIIEMSTNYLCNFTFEGEQWEDEEKFVIFKNNKNKAYVASLGTEMQTSTVIPQAALSGCVLKISVYAGDLYTTNELSLIVTATGYTENTISETPGFTDAFVSAYERIESKFDEAMLEGNTIIFFANGNQIATLDLTTIVLSTQSDWEEEDPDSSHYIKNKPDIDMDFTNLLINITENIRSL